MDAREGGRPARDTATGRRRRRLKRLAIALVPFLVIPATLGVLVLAGHWVVHAVDSNRWIFSSPSIAADSKGDVHIGYGRDGLMYATNRGGHWNVAAIDAPMYVIRTSIAVDRSDNVHIAYCAAALMGTTVVYPFVVRYATNRGGAWSTATIDYGCASGIAVDPQGNVYISYAASDHPSDPWDTYQADVKYATNAGGTWTNATVARVPRGAGTGIGIDSHGHVHIGFADEWRLGYATNDTGTWTNRTVEPLGYSTYSVSLAVDVHDYVHMTYVSSDPQVPQHVAVEYATNEQGNWTASSVDSWPYVIGDFPQSALAVGPDKRVRIVYGGGSRNLLNLATKTEAGWSIETIDRGNNVGLQDSVAVDSMGRIHVAYTAQAWTDDYYSSDRYEVRTATNSVDASNAGDFLIQSLWFVVAAEFAVLAIAYASARPLRRRKGSPSPDSRQAPSEPPDR